MSEQTLRDLVDVLLRKTTATEEGLREVTQKLDALERHTGMKSAWFLGFGHDGKAMWQTFEELQVTFLRLEKSYDALRELARKRCGICHGKGKFTPTCPKCSDSTLDHMDCPGEQECPDCARDGLLPGPEKPPWRPGGHT